MNFPPRFVRCYLILLTPRFGVVSFATSSPKTMAGVVVAAYVTVAKALAPSVVVVGGGVGGLATAGRLQGLGAEVTVLEQNTEFGGRVSEWRKNDWRIEMGASLLLLPETYRETLRALGDVENFDVDRVDPSYSVFFDDGADKVELGGSDEAKLRERLNQEGDGAYDRYVEYLKTAGEYLRTGWPLFVEEDLTKVSLLPRFLNTALREWPLQSHDAHLRRFFPSEPRLRALCSFNDMYVGLTPYDAPAVFSLLAAIELTRGGGGGPRSDLGVYYVRGGLSRYVDRLVAACHRLGVDLRTQATVTKILVDDENRSVRGVRLLNGTEIPADYVVVNADLATAEPQLLGDFARSDYSDRRYSTSSHTFLFALDRRLSELTHHNVFLTSTTINATTDPWRPAWDWAFPPSSGRTTTNEFHFYVCAPARTDPTAAPPGGDAIMVLVPSPALQDDDDDQPDDADAIRTAVLRRLEALCGPVEKHIRYERVVPPHEWRSRFGLRRGAVFGLSHGLDQLALFRPARRSSRADGLAFVGASTRPGNGVPLVLTSAALCAKEVADDLGLV